MQNEEFLEDAGKQAGKCFIKTCKSVIALINRCCCKQN